MMAFGDGFNCERVRIAKMDLSGKRSENARNQKDKAKRNNETRAKKLFRNLLVRWPVGRWHDS